MVQTSPQQEQTATAELELKKRKLGERATDIAKEQVKQKTELRKAQRLFQEVYEKIATSTQRK